MSLTSFCIVLSSFLSPNYYGIGQRIILRTKSKLLATSAPTRARPRAPAMATPPTKTAYSTIAAPRLSACRAFKRPSVPDLELRSSIIPTRRRVHSSSKFFFVQVDMNLFRIDMRIGARKKRFPKNSARAATFSKSLRRGNNDAVTLSRCRAVTGVTSDPGDTASRRAAESAFHAARRTSFRCHQTRDWSSHCMYPQQLLTRANRGRNGNAAGREQEAALG